MQSCMVYKENCIGEAGKGNFQSKAPSLASATLRTESAMQEFTRYNASSFFLRAWKADRINPSMSKF